MKKAILMTCLFLSCNAFAGSLQFCAVNPFCMVTFSPILIPSFTTIAGAQLSTSSLDKVAVQILNDSQEFIQLGTLTPFLNQKIKGIQSLDLLLSDEDALSVLIDLSEQVLK